jgi:hypothetical protein
MLALSCLDAASQALISPFPYSCCTTWQISSTSSPSFSEKVSRWKQDTIEMANCHVSILQASRVSLDFVHCYPIFVRRSQNDVSPARARVLSSGYVAESQWLIALRMNETCKNSWSYYSTLGHYTLSHHDSVMVREIAGMRTVRRFDFTPVCVAHHASIFNNLLENTHDIAAIKPCMALFRNKNTFGDAFRSSCPPCICCRTTDGAVSYMAS